MLLAHTNVYGHNVYRALKDTTNGVVAVHDSGNGMCRFATHLGIIFMDCIGPQVTQEDFEHALTEVTPAFGANTDTLQSYRMHGMFNYGPVFEHLQATLAALVNQVRNSDKTPVLSCLLEGPAGSGKSALAATAAIESEFPFVKVRG